MKTKSMSLKKTKYAFLFVLLLSVAGMTKGYAQGYDDDPSIVLPTHNQEGDQEGSSSIVSQTIALTSGVNWVSFNVDITLDDLKEALVESLPGDDTEITIKSKTRSTRYQNGRWVGQLSGLDKTRMYLIMVGNDCEITLEGSRIDLTELTITIPLGANWIAYPYEESMSITNFFGLFPYNNDQVKSKRQSAKYRGGRWTGQLDFMEPGHGYIYISEDTKVRTFIFPSIDNK